MKMKNVKRGVFLFLFSSLFLFANENTEDDNSSITPLPVIERQLQDAEAKFEEAQKIFNPYYAGPLLTPSAKNVPPGKFNIQPYLFFINTFATYNQNRRSVNIDDTWTINHVFIFQAGLLSWLDLSFVPQVIYNTQNDQHATHLGDTQLLFGFQIAKEGPYIPSIRAALGEIFPSGKFQKLDRKKNGIDGTGTGSYETILSLNFSKVLWWLTTNPFRVRAAFNYIIPSMVHVRSFNVYGGGFNTKGKVRPGNKIQVDTSLELSLTQKWVFALDLVYTYQNRSSFSGRRGITATGTRASVGTPSNDSLSCAPALEYNPTSNMGFLAGAWFTITGRNSGNFIAGVITMTYLW